MKKSLPFFLGSRYSSIRSRSLLVGFISILSILGLSIGVAILITVLSVVNGFDYELRTRLLGIIPHVTVNSARNEALLTQQEWNSLESEIIDLNGVSAVQQQLQLQGMLLANGRSKGILVNGINTEADLNDHPITTFLHEGSLAELQSANFRIILGQQLATQLGVAIGEKVTLVSTVVPVTPLGEFTRQKNFTVSGIFDVGSQIDSNLAYISIRDAQRVYRLGDTIQGLQIQIDDIFATGAIQTRLNQILPLGVITSDWTRSVYGGIYENIRLSKTLVGLILFLLVAVAAFNVVVSLFMVVRDKQGDIAILRTMGTSLTEIRQIFLVQGLIIGFLGTALGLILGIFFSLTVSDIVAWLETLFQIEFLSADVYPINFLPSKIEWADILFVCCSSIFLCLLATIYPSSIAARTNPAEVLRYE